MKLPDRGDALAGRIGAAGHDWVVPPLNGFAGEAIGAFATTRNGGESGGAYSSLNLASGGDDDGHARALNRRRVAAFLPEAPVYLRQVHGRDVVVLDRSNVDAARLSAPVADAAVTATPGIVCAVLTADCMPVLFADREGQAVGAAHAGWRGLAGGVLEATVEALAELGVPASRLAVWLGPAIGPGAFEVGDDVFAAFTATDAGSRVAFVPRPNGKWNADLATLACRRLRQAGVADIHASGACTFADPSRFFSYRREGTTGRQGAFIWRRF